MKPFSTSDAKNSWVCGKTKLEKASLLTKKEKEIFACKYGNEIGRRQRCAGEHYLSVVERLKKTKKITFEYHYKKDNKKNSLGDILQTLEKEGFNYIINPDPVIQSTITKKEYDTYNRYVLIIQAFKDTK